MSHWTTVITIAVGILAAAFIVASEPMLVVFFGGTYAGHRIVLTLMALAIVVEGFGIPAIAGLWAIVQPRANLISTFSGTFTALALAAVLSPWMGISGAAVGALIGRTMTSVMMFAFFWQISRRLVAQEATP